MTEIVVSADVARMIAGAAAPVVIVGPSGEKLGRLAPFSVEEPASTSISDDECNQIRQQMAADDGTRLTWDQVKENLAALATK